MKRILLTFLCLVLLLPGPTARPAAQAAPVAVTLSVNAAAGRHPISPYIYGMSFADPGLAAELRLPVNRWGGNATTRYNWRLDASNRGSDWYFENVANDTADVGGLPAGSDSDEFISANRAAGSQTLLTVPLIGWTPRSRGTECGFSIAKYGSQADADWQWRPDCGNGIRSDNGQPVTGNDPHDTSLEIGPGFVQDWIRHLIAQFGAAGQGGVRFYNLDNEPMLWNSTHRDVHPVGTGYDELRDRTIQYAAAIKAVDPAAQTLGPVLWGWTAYFYSALDIQDGGAWWNTRSDRRAHGDQPFVEWYLDQMRADQQTRGTRLLDYLDLHYYPQASGVALSGAGSSATQALRLRSTRSLWDPAYVDESWIGDSEGAAVRLIPRMRDWVADHYPGTRLAISEYNWGALDHINGALAQADVLGIFGREGLDLAALWGAPEADQPGAFAFRMFLNYDGAGGRFGDMGVRAVTSDYDQLSIYAAQRLSDYALTILVINKTGSAISAPFQLSNFEAQGAVQIYRYSPADLSQIARPVDQGLFENELTITYPANSLTLLVLPPLHPPIRAYLPLTRSNQ